jgi:hypothetical protein
MRGGKRPLVVEVTSSIDDEAGLVVPIPTCACVKVDTNSNKIKRMVFITVLKYFFDSKVTLFKESYKKIIRDLFPRISTFLN